MEENLEHNILAGNHCSSCLKPVKQDARFCPNCGVLQEKEIDEINELKSHLIPTGIFFFTSLIFFGILSVLNVLEDYQSLFYIDIAFSVFILIFAVLDHKEIIPLLSIKGLNFKILFPLILVSILYALLVNIFVNFINVSVLNEGMERYYPLFQDSAFPLLFTILSIALQPAIFEELAFRGFVFNKLNKVGSIGTAIFISAFMFAIIHMSLISIIWILPLGMFYAFLRSKYSTLWYGIFAHFTHNLTIILLELHEDGLLEQYLQIHGM